MSKYDKHDEQDEEKRCCPTEMCDVQQRFHLRGGFESLIIRFLNVLEMLGHERGCEWM
jgi:hypothetical protein